jgi:hypothetical protein
MTTEYKCTRCNYKCYSEKDINRHISRKNKCRDINNTNNTEKYTVTSIEIKCPDCKKHYKTPSALKGHKCKNKPVYKQEKGLEEHDDDEEEDEETERQEEEESEEEKDPLEAIREYRRRKKYNPFDPTNTPLDSMLNPGTYTSIEVSEDGNNKNTTINNVRNITNYIVTVTFENEREYLGNDEFTKFVQVISDKNYKEYGMCINIFGLYLDNGHWKLVDYYNDVTYNEIPVLEDNKPDFFKQLEEDSKDPTKKEYVNQQINDYVKQQLERHERFKKEQARLIKEQEEQEHEEHEEHEEEEEQEHEEYKEKQEAIEVD